jgi:enoyl-CoA hydratase/carnithine racemase
MPSSNTNYPIQTLFHQDGISVTATILTDSSLSTSNPNDIEHNGIILTLNLNRHHEKNVINPTMIQLLTRALDVIDSHDLLSTTHNKSLIITGLGGQEQHKFFSNGLDLQWFASAPSSSRPVMIEQFCSLILARILTLPMRTIAAIQGHCIGAGLFLALSCDYRLMRSKRGYVQWPEVRLGMRLTKGFAELSKAKIGRVRLREGVLVAKRYSPEDALSSGIVDEVVSMEGLYERAFEFAVEGLPENMGLDSFDARGLSEVKMELYTDAYRALKFGKVEDEPHSRI